MIDPINVKLAYACAEWSKYRTSKEIVFTNSEREWLFDNSKWSIKTIRIRKCFFDWGGGMGHRAWCNGFVPNVAKEFRKRRRKYDPIWDLVSNITNGLIIAPIIVYVEGDNFRIDDGCHRAVAAYLSGHKEIEAYVGICPELPDKFKTLTTNWLVSLWRKCND